jgi:hypothetical protein
VVLATPLVVVLFTLPVNKFVNVLGWGIPQMYSGQTGAYCNGYRIPSEIAKCQAAGGTISGFLASFRGNPAVGLKPGDPGNLGYPCPE